MRTAEVDLRGDRQELDISGRDRVWLHGKEGALSAAKCLYTGLGAILALRSPRPPFGSMVA